MRGLLIRAGMLPVLLLTVVPGPVPAAEVKTLEDIRIEGEVRLPRVLFITSRESERPLDFLEHYAPAPAGDAAAAALIPVLGDVLRLEEGTLPLAGADPNDSTVPAVPSTPETTDTSEEVSP